MSRTNYWCFTVNNYNNNDILHYRSLVGRGQATYIIFGFETGQSGTRHLQGYAEFPKRLRLAGARKLLPNAHIEPRRGSASQARDYCSKEGLYEEEGSMSNSNQGKRTDLENLKEAILQKRSLKEISVEHFGSYLKYERSIKSMRLMHSLHRNWVCSVVVYHGPTGSGKTRSVMDNLPTPDHLWTYSGDGWFDGYDGQPIVLFDDFSGSEFKISFLLRLLDRYPMQVRIKGGFTNWCPKEIYITSNLDPNTWYPNAHNEHVNALFRRFTFVYKFE